MTVEVQAEIHSNRELLEEKLARLSPGLRDKITRQIEGRADVRDDVPLPGAPVSAYLCRTKLHCNGGRTVEAGLKLKEHCDQGGKLFLTMSGAGSSFQMGIMISKLIRAGKVAAISVTGANLEESLYRYLAHSAYAHIVDYTSLSEAEELELDHAGFRRITDTFLPEEESVRIVYPLLLDLWREAAAAGTSLLWHEFLFQLFERNLIRPDPEANPEDCWLLQAYKHGVHVCVPGWEDSTMGNIFTHAAYNRKHPFLSRYRLAFPVPASAVRHNFEYMHALAEWYMDTAPTTPLAFLQLGGGIAADFPICVVPHLKKDFLADESIEEQERLIPPWAMFVEIHNAAMSFGSYSGAGYKEKITWGKFKPGSYGVQICGDFTSIFPDIAALILRF